MAMQEGPKEASASKPQRHLCPQCNKSRGLFCEDCLLILERPPAQIRLPVQVDIVQHGETNARSTALHAALLASADVKVHRHANTTTSRRCDPLDLPLPDFDPAATVVLFPEGPETPVVGQCLPFQRVVVLESTWKKVRGLLKHPKLAPLRRVQLPPDIAKTQFSWRRGDGSFRGAVDEGVSSIEAIVHCCRLVRGQGESCKSYDGLLRYFLHTKLLVEQRGPLPTSRQQARQQARPQQLDHQGRQQRQRREEKREQQQEEQPQAAAAAGGRGGQGRAAALGGAGAAVLVGVGAGTQIAAEAAAKIG